MRHSALNKLMVVLNVHVHAIFLDKYICKLKINVVSP